MLLVWRMRQEIEFQRTRALVNTIIVSSQPDRTDAAKMLEQHWDEFRHTMFPYQRAMTQSQDQAALEYLRKEVARGPVQVRPLAPLTSTPGMRSRRRKPRP